MNNIRYPYHLNLPPSRQISTQSFGKLTDSIVLFVPPPSNDFSKTNSFTLGLSIVTSSGITNTSASSLVSLGKPTLIASFIPSRCVASGRAPITSSRNSSVATIHAAGRPKYGSLVAPIWSASITLCLRKNCGILCGRVWWKNFKSRVAVSWKKRPPSLKH